MDCTTARERLVVLVVWNLRRDTPRPTHALLFECHDFKPDHLSPRNAILIGCIVGTIGNMISQVVSTKRLKHTQTIQTTIV